MFACVCGCEIIVNIHFTPFDKSIAKWNIKTQEKFHEIAQKCCGGIKELKTQERCCKRYSKEFIFLLTYYMQVVNYQFL